MKKVLIVGGGFSGVRCALDLAHSRYSSELDITLISDKPHFEYHAYLYRVVSGITPLEVCIPLFEIFDKTKVSVVKDSVIGADLKNKIVFGPLNSNYHYDYLVLALGSQTEFYGIPGLEEYSFSFKSISEALQLKNHIHEMFNKAALSNEKNIYAHFVVIGGGPSGVELSGELAKYCKVVAKKHKVDTTIVKIDLIEAASRILPTLPEDVSKIAEKRLRDLGVNIMTNEKVMKENVNELYLNDARIKSKTIIWTAGVKTNEFYQKVAQTNPGIELNKKGQVLVDQFLNPAGISEVFIAGDAAQTKFSGMAQTALDNGKFVTQSILSDIRGIPRETHIPKPPIFAIPIGAGWAIVKLGNLKITGIMGWILRRIADFRFFASILPLDKAITAFSLDSQLCETCDICSN